MIRLATIFSGIGSIEQTLLRLGIEHEIVFACDNGDVEINLLEGDDLLDYKRLTKLRSKKQLRDPKDIKRLEELGKKENSIAEGIRAKICSMQSCQSLVISSTSLEKLFSKYKWTMSPINRGKSS